MEVGAPSAVRLTHASEEALQKLRRTVEGVGGFALYIVLAVGHARREFVRRLAAWEDLDHFPRCVRTQEGEEGAADVARMLDELDHGPTAQGWLLLAGDAMATPAGESLLRRLNADRDRLPRAVAGPLLVVLSPQAEAVWRRLAPDLYSVRRGAYELSADAPPPLPEPAHAPAPRARREDRITELLEVAARLRELELDGEGQGALSDRWRSLGESYAEAGAEDLASLAFDDAVRLARLVGYDQGVARALLEKADLHGYSPPEVREPWLREALALATANGWRFHRLRAWLRLAECAKKRGEVVDALRVLREECLPLTEGPGEEAVVRHRIGDLWSLQGDRAAALRELHHARDTFEQLGKQALTAQVDLDIAEIDMARGRLEDARRALVERVIPAFEAARNAHGRATAQKQLARIDAHEGRHQQALGMLLDEVIPTFERIHDRHCASLARRAAAEAFERLGQPERAEALLEGEVLPVNDHHSAALTRADNLLYLARLQGARGALQEALRTLRAEVIPELDRLDAKKLAAEAYTLTEQLGARQRSVN